MNKTALGIALGVGISASVLASAYMLNRGTSGDEPQQVASREECWNETVTTTRSTRDNQVAGIAIGGALGGLAGNQIGEGNGKSAATAAGAVAGALIGKNAGKPKTYQESHVVRRCN